MFIFIFLLELSLFLEYFGGRVAGRSLMSVVAVVAIVIAAANLAYILVCVCV